MRLTAIALIPALIWPLAALEVPPLAQRIQGVLRLPEPELLKHQIELERAPDHPEKSYWQALVVYARLSQTQDPIIGDELLAVALRHLKGRTDADSLALKGSLCGMAIGLHPEQAMDLVNQAMTSFSRAKGLEPRNPRVRFFESVHHFQTPEAFGGGPSVALPMLEATVALAEAEQPTANPWAPAWGKAESLAWLALAEVKKDRMARAKTHLARCLMLDPNYGFVKTFVAPYIKQ